MYKVGYRNVQSKFEQTYRLVDIIPINPFPSPDPGKNAHTMHFHKQMTLLINYYMGECSHGPKINLYTEIWSIGNHWGRPLQHSDPKSWVVG